MFRLTSNRCRVAETNIRELKGVEFLYFKLSKFLLIIVDLSLVAQLSLFYVLGPLLIVTKILK